MTSLEHSNTKIEKIMSSNVISLDITKTAGHAADLMTEKRVGSIVVTKNSKVFGIASHTNIPSATNNR
jgi:predicted transcriptional regulator